MYVRYTFYTSVNISLLISFVIFNLSAVYIGPEILWCKKIKLLIISTFAGSWIEFQQTIICFVTEYVVGCASYRLHGLSSLALDNLTLNFSYNKTSAEFHMSRHFLELHSYITYCFSEHQCLAQVHLGSVGMIMRILIITVIILITRCTEQLFMSVTPGTYRQLKFWDRRHETEYIAWGSYCLYSVPRVRGLVAGQCRPQHLLAHPSQNTKIDTSH